MRHLVLLVAKLLYFLARATQSLASSRRDGEVAAPDTVLLSVGRVAREPYPHRTNAVTAMKLLKCPARMAPPGTSVGSTGQLHGRHRDQEVSTLTELLNRVEHAAQDRDAVAMRTIVEAVGRRSFGPLLLVAGLIALSPISGIPGAPTTVAIVVLLTAGQLVLRRSHFWLPRWLLDRTVSRHWFDAALRWLRPAARGVDRLLRPRLGALTRDAGVYAIAMLCVAIAVAMPLMELLPFAATVAGAALATLGLALIAHDGALVLVAVAFTVTTCALVVYSFL